MDAWDDNDNDGDNEEVRDFTFGGKDALIFLVDATKAMRKKIHGKKDQEDEDEDVATPLQMALKAVEATIKTKVFANPNDLVGVLLFGTKNKVDVRDFDNLSVLLPLDTPESESILKLEAIRRGLAGGDAGDVDEDFDRKYGSAGQDEFSLHEALWQCQALFADVVGKVGSKMVTVLTCVDDPHAEEDKKAQQARQKAGDLHDTGVVLDVLPVGVRPKAFNMDTFYRDLVQLSQDVPYQAADPAERYEDLMRLIRKRVHKKRSVGRITFDLGKGVKIGVATYNFVQKAYKPSKVKLAKDTNEEVKIQRTFINHATGAPLLPSDMNKFQEYGGRRIKFTFDEAKSVTTLDGKLGLRLCGFKPLSSLKWSHFVKSGNFIYPEERLIKGSRNLFAALLIKCTEKKVYAVCSYKPRDNSSPSFVALVPQEEVKDESGKQEQPPGFNLVFLPFSDDLRNVPEVKLVEPDPDQVSAAKKMIRKLRMEDYNPDAFENPDMQAHFCLIEGLALKRDEVERPEDNSKPDWEMQSELLKNTAKDFLESVYPAGYDPSAAPSKRKAASAPRKDAPKRAKAEVNPDTLDMGAHVKAKTVNKLTVVQLKEYLKSIDFDVGNKKKADLVSAVYEHFG